MSKYRLSCNADTHCISMIDQWLLERLPKEYIKDFRGFCLAAHELVINSVEAVHTMKDGMKLGAECCIESDRISFAIIDYGKGLTEKQVECFVNSEYVENPENMLQEHGRGFLLIRKYSDQFSYEAISGGGFRYTIIKYIKD